MVDDTEGRRDVCVDAIDCGAVFSPSRSSSESSPPMAKGPFSSGMRLNDDRVSEEAWRSSDDCEGVGLVTESKLCLAFLLSFCRSISCCPLSSVKVRTASKRF